MGVQVCSCIQRNQVVPLSQIQIEFKNPLKKKISTKTSTEKTSNSSIPSPGKSFSTKLLLNTKYTPPTINGVKMKHKSGHNSHRSQ